MKSTTVVDFIRERYTLASAPDPGGVMTEVVLSEVGDDGVAMITLNRPDRLNAWTYEMQLAVFDRLQEHAADERVRAIVLTGAGRGFCAGADMQDLGALSAAAGENGDAAQDALGERHDPRPITFPLSIPKPIIAAINGPCAGLGLVVALMCDIRICAAGAKLTTAFARRGLVAEHGIAWMLPRLVGPARALDLLFSGRVVLGDEAAALGVVNRAVADDRVLDESLAYARELATHSSPASMATMKRQVYGDFNRSLADALQTANRLMLESFSKPDFAEGVQSFMERRPPQFAPLTAPVAAS
jgi:enoyl-CoA hydratase/carnithine racemase